MSKLDIFDSLARADKSEYGYYSTLDEKMKKQYSPWLFNRWMSATKSNQEYHIIFTNELCNVEMGCLTKHPELQWMLMCAAGSGKTQRHEWVKPASKAKKDKKYEFLKKVYPELKYDEIETLCLLKSDEEIASIALSMGFQDDEIKELI